MTSIDLDGKTVYVHGGMPGEDDARWTVSHRMLQVHIHVIHATIVHTAWADEYFDRRSALFASEGGGDNTLARWKALSRCIASPCLSVFETLTPADKTSPWTLADYCLPATVSVRIVRASSVSNGGRGVCVELVSGPHSQPAYSTSPMPTQMLHNVPATLLRVPASELLVGNKEEISLHLAPPSQVWAAEDDDHVPLFFNPCTRDRENEFEREVDMLARIDAAGLADQQINTARMIGVVTTEDGAAVLGALLVWISGAPLVAETAVAHREMHWQWREAVQGIIGALHEHGIIWGNINPHSILIDEQLAAWVVDFEGNCNIEFVDEENKETVEGDWQGFHRLFDCWLPARVAALSPLGR